MFSVTRRFTSGPLEGLDYTEETSVPWTVGERIDNPLGMSGYVITSVEAL